MRLIKNFAMPAGCGYIFSSNVGVLRRIVWFLFIVAGITYSTFIIFKSWILYSTYPSSIKPAFSAKDILKFPKGEKYILDNTGSGNSSYSLL